MITRDEYLRALKIVELYRKQCSDDLILSDAVVTSIDPEAKFINLSSTRLYQAIMNSEFFPWSNDYTVRELASLVNEYGIKEIRKNRGFGGKIGLELESIIFNIGNVAEEKILETKILGAVESFERRKSRIAAQMDKNPRYQIKPKKQ